MSSEKTLRERLCAAANYQGYYVEKVLKKMLGGPAKKAIELFRHGGFSTVDESAALPGLASAWKFSNSKSSSQPFCFHFPMARALRFERVGGRYHVTDRGNERKPIFRDDPDRFHFLELLSELAERFGTRLHAFVLMDNHFHLLVETPEANLSRAMQWLGVSYSVWFNRRHNRAGHLFQGRFKAIIIEQDADLQEVARYLHLNPVRIAGLGLDKRQRAASRAGTVAKPKPELIAERLRILREFRWSSYRGYAGYSAALPWVCQQPLAFLCGGRTEQECRAALREYTEQAIRQGTVESPWGRLIAGIILGTEAFAQRLRRQTRGNPREQAQLKALSKPVAWDEIVSTLEQAKGELWEQFSQRHGDWGRDAALWLGRRQGRLSLAQLGELAGDIDYAAVGQAVSRFGKRLQDSDALRRQITKIQSQLSNVEM
jgi:REP element-mobilizing transposase RayT